MRRNENARIHGLHRQSPRPIVGVQQEIETLRQATKVDIAGVQREIETLKVDLLKWLFGALIAQGGLIVALVKLL